MFGPIGMQEMLLILAAALLIFGPRKLPEIGRTLGRGMAEFRRATSDLKRSIDVELDEEKRRPPARRIDTPASSVGASADATTLGGQTKPREPDPGVPSDPAV